MLLIMASGKIILRGDFMTNFERLKLLESEYEMADIIMNFLSTHFSEVIKKDGEINGLPLLRWLQEQQKTNNE